MSETVREALNVVDDTMSFSSRDWGASADLAILWAVFCGWDDEDNPTESAYPELAERFGWAAEDVAKFRQFHAAIQSARSETPANPSDSLRARLTAFARDCTLNGDMTPAAERMLRQILEES
ncbi:hypothetical protein [Williamsia phyllosphaerae]|uniref:Uncharacterized protein n=1 Tax=Williamsia phyllosphaerae TaxID=885042 RepID=A0ABQ1V4R9_9NOCA|nr:hypothetical protein [Williamsia phyllosphaerae]GGF38970.1 hypothetical protein GCM10007298_38330 [Williamsia phyllosphaerae]